MGTAVKHIKTQKIPVSDLAIGMYVSGLDRPWTETPFPLQGFHIKLVEDIKLVQRYCEFVFIDVALSSRDLQLDILGADMQRGSELPQKKKGPAAVKTSSQAPASKPSRARDLSSSPEHPPARMRSGVTQYHVESSFKKEIKQAVKIQRSAEKALNQVMKSIAHSDLIDIKPVKKTAMAMVDSVIRNPDAFIWLSRAEEHDSYIFQHAMQSTVWGLLLARHIGLAKRDLYCLATALMLSVAGKVQLPRELLADNLTEEQKNQYKQHVNFSISALERIPDIEPQVLYVVRHYCERHNGTGYPEGLRGNAIPFLARIAGLVDTFQSWIGPRDDVKALSITDALADLYQLRNRDFQAELVENLIQAIGIYPPGSLIQLSDGRKGVVLEQRRERRLQPKIAVITNGEGQRLEKIGTLDMEKETVDRFGHPLRIQKSLPQTQWNELGKDLKTLITAKISKAAASKMAGPGLTLN